MPMINLLPWREELRQKRKKEFFLSVFGAVLLAAALTMGTKAYYRAQISGQESRNQILRTEIEELDKLIAEINEFDTRKRRLLDRMEIIDQLERTTPEAVMLVDSLVDIMTEGTYLTAVNQSGTRVELAGRSRSNQRVADLLRNVDSALWLKTPLLDDVVTEGDGPQRSNQFNVSFDQVRISENEEALR
jgi:type IV pilus assembly protein PilN